MTILDELAELNPQALYPTGFEDAVVGYSECPGEPIRAVVHVGKCLDILAQDQHLDPEDAREYFEFNVQGSYVGDHGPVYVNLVEGL